MYSSSLTTHLSHLETVFQILSTNSIRVKLSKCSFGQTTIDYLGHSISKHDIAVDNFKIHAITDWPQPTSLKSLRGFLGLTSYYRKFVRNYDLIEKPLTNMLKQGNFFWTTDSLTTFTSLNHALAINLVLALPNFSKEFVVETDTFGTGIGDVLCQDGHPIAFLNKALSRAQSRSSHLRQRNAIRSQSYDDILQTFHMLN